MARPIPFACPKCHNILSEAQASFACTACGKGYPSIDGIPSFVGEDAFYEGKWLEPDFSAGSPRNWLVKKERFFLSGLRGRKGSVLDLGCGGGWKLFADVGVAVGVDVSLSSLRNARRLYSQVAQAKLSELPFEDGSFDFVVSSDVLGHVSLEGKGTVLREIYRVLKRGGRTLNYVETDGDDPIMRFAKGYPELYSKHIVEPEGHIGLERAAEVVSRFAGAGLRPVRVEFCYKGLIYAGRFVQYFDNEYKGKSAPVRGLVAICKLATAAKPIELAANLGMSLLIELGDVVFPESWAGGIAVCFEKP